MATICKQGSHISLFPVMILRSVHHPSPDPDVGDHAALQDVVPNVRGGPGLDEQIAEL